MDLPPEAPLPPGSRVVAALSGGVDSAVAAALMVEAGHEVVGITLRLSDGGTGRAARGGTCCAGRDIEDAAEVATRLGIPHYVVDHEAAFRRDVIAEFADSYAMGRTPVPCVRCNERVKFRDLAQLARDLGAARLVTGHYVRRWDGPEGPGLARADDMSRDQSYFLFATTRAQLAGLGFPLGGLPKPQVRAMARARDLPVADKPDSQDICFVAGGDYAAVVQALRPETRAPGEIVHLDGTVLGQHDGTVGFTIGQRRGLGVGGRAGADGAPLYVVGVDPAARRVTVGPRAALARDRVTISQLNWLGPDLPDAGRAVAVRLRSAQAPAPAWLVPDGAGGGQVTLARPQYGVAPGQACVAYDGPILLGGGWIEAATLSEAGRAAA